MGGFLERRRQQKALEREMKLREGKARIEQHVRKQKDAARKLRDLARRALLLDDQAQFKQLGQRYLLLMLDIRRKERILVMLDALKTQLDVSRNNVEFMRAIQDLTGAVVDLSGPQNLAAMQRDVEQGLARAESLSDRLDVLMELANDGLLGAGAELGEDKLRELETAMLNESGAEPGTVYDSRIEDALKRLAEDMRRS